MPVDLKEFRLSVHTWKRTTSHVRGACVLGSRVLLASPRAVRQPAGGRASVVRELNFKSKRASDGRQCIERLWGGSQTGGGSRFVQKNERTNHQLQSQSTRSTVTVSPAMPGVWNQSKLPTNKVSVAGNCNLAFLQRPSGRRQTETVWPGRAVWCKSAVVREHDWDGGGPGWCVPNRGTC